MAKVSNGAKYGGLAVLALLVFGLGYKYLRGKKLGSDKSTTEQTVSGGNIEVSSDANLVLLYNTFPGMKGILYMNGGMEPNKDSRLYKDYGILLQIKQVDVGSDARNALKTGIADAIYCTIDALPIDMSSGSDLLNVNAKARLKINESRGADAIVVTSSVKSVADLKGKTVAYAVGTASNTLLINTLDAAGLSTDDIILKKVQDGVEASQAFKSGAVDAAVVWAPDDEDCVAAVKGSKILISTGTATQIIADGLLITDERYSKKKDLLNKLGSAWMVGNALMNTDQSAIKEANALFVKGFKLPAEVVDASNSKIRFSTLEDNKAFFGYDATYTGVTGEKMYSRMAVKYTDAKLAKAPVSWRQASDGSLVEALMKDQTLASSATQKSDNGGAKEFTPTTEADKTAPALSNKVVTLTFSSGNFQLDDQAKNVINREITALAQGFTNAKLRIEGNTDNTGNASLNKSLSAKRAQAVANYLISEYKMSRNRFIIIGNGSDKPVSGCESNSNEDCKSKNRRTDFQFVIN